MRWSEWATCQNKFHDEYDYLTIIADDDEVTSSRTGKFHEYEWGKASIETIDDGHLANSHEKFDLDSYENVVYDTDYYERGSYTVESNGANKLTVEFYDLTETLLYESKFTSSGETKFSFSESLPPRWGLLTETLASKAEQAYNEQGSYWQSTTVTPPAFGSSTPTITTTSRRDGFYDSLETMRVDLITNFSINQDGDTDGNGIDEPHRLESELDEFFETKYEVLDGSYIWTYTGFTADHDFKYTETEGVATTSIRLSGDYVDLFGTPVDQTKLEAYLAQPEWLLPEPPPSDSDFPFNYPAGTGEPTTKLDPSTVSEDDVTDVLDGSALLRRSILTKNYRETGAVQLQTGQAPTLQADFEEDQTVEIEFGGVASGNYTIVSGDDTSNGAGLSFQKSNANEQYHHSGTTNNDATGSREFHSGSASVTAESNVSVTDYDIQFYDEFTPDGHETGLRYYYSAETANYRQQGTSTYHEDGRTLDGETSLSHDHFFLFADLGRLEAYDGWEGTKSFRQLDTNKDSYNDTTVEEFDSDNNRLSLQVDYTYDESYEYSDKYNWDGSRNRSGSGWTDNETDKLEEVDRGDGNRHEEGHKAFNPHAQILSHTYTVDGTSTSHVHTTTDYTCD